MKLPEIKINFVAIWRLFRKYILRERIPQPQFFGLIKDKTDDRDLVYMFFRKAEYPASTNRVNFKNFPFRWDQGTAGSCTGHGGSAGFIRALQKNGQPVFEPSRIFAYFNARTDDNKTTDSGASIRDLIKALAKYGLCTEALWQSDPLKFAVRPSAEAYIEAEKHQAITYEKLFPVTKHAIMDAISSGYAVVYGQLLYESFMSEKVAASGIVPVPRKCVEQQIGGHCKCILDYEEVGVFELNSWGRKWGIDGGCLIPWKYVLDPDLSFDFWVIKVTE
jgi:hypothetical protein